MSKTKKLIATGLAIVSIAAVPSTSIALSGASQALRWPVAAPGVAAAARRCISAESPARGSPCQWAAVGVGNRRRTRAAAAAFSFLSYSARARLTRSSASPFDPARSRISASARSASAWRFSASVCMASSTVSRARACAFAGSPCLARSFASTGFLVRAASRSSSPADARARPYPFGCFVVTPLLVERRRELRCSGRKHGGLVKLLKERACRAQCALGGLREIGQQLDHPDRASAVINGRGRQPERAVQTACMLDVSARDIEVPSHRLEPTEPDRRVCLGGKVARVSGTKLLEPRDRRPDRLRAKVERQSEQFDGA